MHAIPVHPSGASPERTPQRILVPYDRSPGTDAAVEYGLCWAQRVSARLFILALAPVPTADDDPYFPPGAFLTDDLIAFAKLGQSMGVDVDGTLLNAPSLDALKQVLGSHGIDQVLLPPLRGAADMPMSDLLRQLAQDCPVPVACLDAGVPEGVA